VIVAEISKFDDEYAFYGSMSKPVVHCKGESVEQVKRFGDTSSVLPLLYYD
jgi:hypothetical protein